MVIKKIKQTEPLIKLIISDGSERSTYMPQEMALDWLGRPHCAVNLMSCYYPKQSFWPERMLFSDKVYHYRHSLADEQPHTPLKDINDWTDGYYSLDLNNSRNDVVQQLEDVRRYGQDIRLTITADLDTTDEDLRRIAEMVKDFCPMEIRLNHEAGGCGWFRFAKNVKYMDEDSTRKTHYEISQFFIRAKRVITETAPGVTFAYSEDLNYAGDDQMGLMLKEPGVIPGIDCYGSLHFGWPGHRIENPPVIGSVDRKEHQASYRTPWHVCEKIFHQFQIGISDLRGEHCRIDLGEFNYDEDIHGPEIKAQLLHECYHWIAANPEVIGSVVHYELTDRGGLGLLHEPEYNQLENVIPCVPVLRMYKDVMTWPEFISPVNETDTIGSDQKRVSLLWQSALNAEGLELINAGVKGSLDFGEAYWRRVILISGDGEETFLHTDSETIDLPSGVEKIRLFVLPPNGRNNCEDGYRLSVPIPKFLVS